MNRYEMARLRCQYEWQRESAKRILSAPQGEREVIAARCYEDYFASFPPAIIDDCNRMGSSRNRDLFLRELISRRTRILEVGCGFGTTLASLDDGEKVLHGIDVVPQNYSEKAKAHPSIHFERLGAVNFDFSEEPFDAIYSIDVLEHLHPGDSPAHFLSVFRSLVPHGCYIVMTPNAMTGPHDLSRFFDCKARGFHLKEYRYAEVVSLGRSAGFCRARTPLLPFGMYGWHPGLARCTLLPATAKVWLEPFLRLMPSHRLRIFLARTAALETVCVIFDKAS